MRLPRERWRNNFLRKSLNVSALNTSHMARTNLPALKLTAPKHATDLRVGACCKTGSFISGGIHISTCGDVNRAVGNGIRRYPIVQCPCALPSGAVFFTAEIGRA